MTSEPTYDVLSRGQYVTVNKPKAEAFSVAAAFTRGRTVEVQGKTCPAIACVFNHRAPKPGELDRPVAMFEDGREVPVPR